MPDDAISKLIEALLGAGGGAAMATLADYVFSVTDPNAPKRVLADARKSLKVVNQWARAQSRLSSLPDTEAKERAGKCADHILSDAIDRRAAYSADILRRRSSVATLLRSIRLTPPPRPLLWIPAVVFYACVVLSVRAVYLCVMSPHRVGIFAPIFFLVLGIASWFLSGPWKWKK
jgi:hypothetical protein